MPHPNLQLGVLIKLIPCIHDAQSDLFIHTTRYYCTVQFVKIFQSLRVRNVNSGFPRIQTNTTSDASDITSYLSSSSFSSPSVLSPSQHAWLHFLSICFTFYKTRAVVHFVRIVECLGSREFGNDDDLIRACASLI